MSYKILIIEDDVSIRTGIKIYLEKVGHTIVVADDGFEALDLIKEDQPDIVILDLKLPGMSGLELLEIINKEYPSIPIIVISGTDSIDDVVTAHKLGAWDYIKKPILKFEIIELSISVVMKRFNLERDNSIYQEKLKKLIDQRTEKIKKQSGELKEMLSSLEFSNERNKVLSENSFLGLIFISNGKIVDYNRQFLEIFKISESDILNPFVEEYFIENDLDFVINPNVDEDEGVKEVDAINKDGVIFPVEIQRKEIFSKNRKIVSVAIKDVSESKAIERESLTLSNYFEKVLNSLPFLLLGCNRYGEIVFANKNVETILNKSSKSIVDAKVGFVLPFIPDIREKLIKVFDTNQELYIPRLEVKYNSLKFIDLNIVPISTPVGLQAIIKICDITEQEDKEAQLRQAQKMESIGNLAGGLAHDFNNVLGGISGSASLIRFKYKPEGEFKEYIELIESSVSRAADMVKQLMTLSKKQELSFAPTDINLSLKHVIKICKNTFDKCINISFSEASSTAIVSADPTQLEQIFLNICINASHAMTIMRGEGETHGGELTISVRGFKPDSNFIQKYSDVDSNKQFWRVTISDTGVGIPSKNLEKLYEPFFTTKDKDTGSGLGLSMVYNLINLHGGYLDIETEVGKGSSFNIYFPKKQDTGSSISKQFSVVDHIAGDGTILLIDDEKIIRKVGKDMLEEFGYMVETASDGVEAIDIFQTSNMDFVAIILDINMPKQSGEETFKQLRILNPKIPIFIASGYKKDGVISSLLDRGAAGFIQKPYTLGNLSDLLEHSI